MHYMLDKKLKHSHVLAMELIDWPITLSFMAWISYVAKLYFQLNLLLLYETNNADLKFLKFQRKELTNYLSYLNDYLHLIKFYISLYIFLQTLYTK